MKLAVSFATAAFVIGAAAMAIAADPPKAAAGKNPIVEIKTSLGVIKAEIFADKSPGTAKNFLEYVDAKHYDGTIFHRVIPKFMVQGGGFNKEMKEKDTRPPIKNEAANGLKNEIGTLAMARTPDPDSASAQFFINTAENAFLNYKGPGPGAGYAVFGKVVDGMAVVEKISAVQTGNQGMHSDVPTTPVVIESIRRAGK